MTSTHSGFRSLVSLCATLFAALLFAVSARAETLPQGALSRWGIDAANPEASVPKPEDLEREPIQAGYFLMDLGVAADQAMQRKDYAAAIRYYKAIQKMVPERSVSYVKICQTYELMGERQQALESCKGAMNHEGATPNDAAIYVRLLTGGPSVSPEQLAEANAVIAHLKKEKVDAGALALIECEMAVQMEDEPRLAACTSVLQAKAPNDPRSISYQWSYAVKRGDYGSAKALVAHARALEMAPEALDKMVEGTKAIRYAWLRRFWPLAIGALAAAMVALGVLQSRKAARAPRTATV